MIRINLVGEVRKPVAARAASPAVSGVAGESRIADWALLGVTVVGLMVALGHYLILRGQIKDMREQIQVAQAEVDRLAPIIREVQAFKRKKARLKRKLQVISDLKANQVAPVTVMDKVSKALPELLWLNQMQVGGARLRLTGQAFNTNAIATLIENLDRVEEFREPVLRDTTRRGNVFHFVIECYYLEPAILRRQRQEEQQAAEESEEQPAAAASAGPQAAAGSGG